ncbi:MAG: DUF4097 domain-containing protein [Lachnospiraceae bacterium]|nr:DUF4097 domain-containing protein [Lachnospiraceae bacterium]
MKRTIYLVTISIITVLVIILSTGIRSGKMLGNVLSDGFGWIGNEKHNSKDNIKEAQTLEAFENVEIDTTASDIRIVYGDNFSYTYKGEKKLLPNFSVENNTLKIVENSSSSMDFGFDFDSIKCRTTITIPDGTKLENIKAKSSAGNIDIDDINAENIDINMSAGNVTLDNVNIKEADLKLSAGNCESSDSYFNSINCDCSAGNATFTCVSFKEFEANMSAGNIEVESEIPLDDATINADASMLHINDAHIKNNHFTQKSADSPSVKIKCTAGNADLNW